MRRPAFRSLDEYERHFRNRTLAWPPERYAAFAAAMGERWFPAYASFSSREGWGEPAVVRAALDAVWEHLRGRELHSEDVARRAAALLEQTPHMDDFEANDALSACVIARDALRSCVRGDQAGALAWDSALSGLAAVAPELVEDEDEGARDVYKRTPVTRELDAQWRVIAEVAALDLPDERAVAELRERLTRPELVGEAVPAARPAEPAGRTNQELFEQYRAIITLDARGGRVQAHIPGGSTGTFVMILIGAWAARYARRRTVIDGGYGRLADAVAPSALVARQRARNVVPASAPMWDAEANWWVEQYFLGPHNSLDVRSVHEPTGYGPSLRRLWVEAKEEAVSDDVAWERLGDWAAHRPAAWDREDTRKRRTRSREARMMRAHLVRSVAWSATGNVEVPWAATVDGARWEVRLNDFPDDVMYTLLVEGVVVDDFHEWPGTWVR